MNYSQIEMFELFSRWKEDKVPLQCHYLRPTDPIHVPRGFITAVFPEAFEFTPFWSGNAECLTFHYAGGEGEYSRRLREMSPSAGSSLRNCQGGILTLRALDGTLMFIELDTE